MKILVPSLPILLMLFWELEARKTKNEDFHHDDHNDGIKNSQFVTAVENVYGNATGPIKSVVDAFNEEIMMFRQENKIFNVMALLFDFHLASYEVYFAFRHIFEYIAHFIHTLRVALRQLNVFLEAVDLPMIVIP